MRLVQRGRSSHFSVGFGFDSYRNKDALDVLVVGYDSAFGSGDGYVQSAVRIEGGARPDPVPVEPREIAPYVAGELPSGAGLKFGGVTTVKPERTFWEKVLILHAMTEMTEKRVADNDPRRPVPDLNRYSRHYYDVHQIWRHADYGEKAASMRGLAEACRQHKQLMFRAPDHGYERAEPGSYRLMPTEGMRKKLETDYERMSAMIFGTPPNVEEIMVSIEQLENFINDRQNKASY